MTTTLGKSIYRLNKILGAVEKKIAKLDVPRLENTPKRSAQAQLARCELWNWEDTRDHLVVAINKLEADGDGVFDPPLPTSATEAYSWCRREIVHPSYYTYSLSDTHVCKDECAVTFRAWADPGDRTARLRARELAKLLSDIRGRPIPGFFPTPAAIAAKVVEEARLFPNARVLEPSCGIGSLIDATLKLASGLGDLKIIVDAFEVNDLLASYCKEKYKGCRQVGVANADFLGAYAPPPELLYDCVVMNPPFENKQAYAHIQHALGFLKPGGRLVSIVPSNFRPSDLKGNVDCHLELLPSNSFNSAVESFRQTSVSVALLTIDKYT